MKRSLILIAALAAVAVAPVQSGAQNTPNTVTLSAAPTLVKFGNSVVLSGQVTGAGNTGVKVDLQSDEFPFGEFKNAGASGVTDANGNYSFTVKPVRLTRYQVTAKAKPNVTSPVAEVRVRPALQFAVNDATARRGQRITFTGAVFPGHPGKVRLQRRIGTGSFRTIATPTLVVAADRSTFVHRLRARRTAVYRFRLAADADHTAATSRKRRVRVR